MGRWKFSAAVLAMALAMQAYGEATSQPLPTQGDIQKLVDAGSYADALKAIGQLLPTLSSQATPSAKRYALYMLCGECQLQSKQSSDAAAAFASAVHDAPKPADAAVPDATALLIKRSTNFAYTPKATKDKLPPTPPVSPAKKAASKATASVLADPPPAGTAIDILDKQSRATALLGLFYDELIADTAKLKEIKAETTVVPAVDFAPTLPTLRHVEIAATGTDTFSAAMIDDLTAHAHSLMSKALTSLGSQVDGIRRTANESVTIEVPSTTGTGKNQKATMKKEYKLRGLASGDNATLENAIVTCKKVDDAVKTLNTTLSLPASTFGAIVSEADAIRKKATATLNADYSKVSTSPPK